MSDKPKILIIGAGVAGLSAGIYARKNGFDTTIYEMHDIPGGLCTSWRRRGYTFDGAVRYLAGIHPNVKSYQLWEEIGIFKNANFYYYDEFICIEGRDGRSLHIYTDIDSLKAHLLELSSQDEALINEFIAGIHDFRRLDLPVDITAADPREFAAIGREMLPVLLPTLKWRNTTVEEFAARFKDPLLKEGLPLFFQFSPPDFPMMLCLSTLGMLHDKEAAYPLGGSLPIAKSLEARYLALGGKIRYRTRVTDILVKDDCAIGVELNGTKKVLGDIIISASDGRTTIFDLLEGKFTDKKICEIYQGGMTASKSILQISLGVDMDFSDQPPMINFPLSEPIWLGNIRHDRLTLKHYCFDPNMAPEGKSSLTLWCEADYDYWHWLSKNRERYDAHKHEIAEVIIAILEARYPGFLDAVEVVDIATPITYEHYTGNWRGAFAGWALTTRKMSMMMGIGMDKTLPGLEGFYMIGQWVEPGGNVELSCASGRDVIRDICRNLDIDFVTKPPR